MALNIDKLSVGKCYKLESSGAYLGKLVAEPEITGISDGRDLTAYFLHKGNGKYVGRSDFTYGSGKENKFILVECEKNGGRRKSRKSSKKGRRSTRRN